MFYSQRYDLNKHKKVETEERFLSYVSHRIRTPLNSVIGFSKLLQNIDDSDDKTKEFAERIMDSGYQILQYFQNLIDLSELESGMIKVNPGRFALNRFLSEILDGYKDRLESDHTLDIYLMNYKDEVVVYQDEFILERVITNLIELVRSNIQKGMISIEYEFTNHENFVIEVRGIRGQDTEVASNNLEPSDDFESDEYDYLTWKTVNQLISLVSGGVTCRSDKREVIYRINIARNM